MEIRNREAQPPFTTKDGSTIRSLLDLSNAPVALQSLAEATLPAGTATQRHYHRQSEEFYYLLAGRGLMEIDGEEREVGPGDAILIPAGAWHRIHALEALQFLCCCAPPVALFQMRHSPAPSTRARESKGIKHETRESGGFWNQGTEKLREGNGC
jgi:mannose-6-phosphate isomerase-like protein (cupin superfamily)